MIKTHWEEGHLEVEFYHKGTLVDSVMFFPDDVEQLKLTLKEEKE